MLTSDPSEYPSSFGAIVVIGDIENFSLLKVTDQKNLVKNIWKFLQTNPLVIKSNDVCINGTGDGAVIAFPNNNETISHEEVVEFAVNWVQFMNNYSADIKLRVGIHQGLCERYIPQFVKNEQVVKFPIQVIGNAVNDCARLTGIGDGNDIVVSEEFLKTAEEKDTILFKTWPKNYIDVFVKHEMPQKVKFIEHKYRPSTPARKIATFNVVRDRINIELAVISKQFFAGIHKFSSKKNINKKSISARISIFTPILRNTVLSRRLESTDFRYCEFDKNHEHKSDTVYSIENNGVGPLGKAFCNHDGIFIIKDLPDYKINQEEYIKMLESTELTKDEIAKFGRKARSFVSIAFGISEQKPFDGVVCIDCLHPLDFLNEGELRIIAGQIKKHCSNVLSYLWKLRTNI